VSCDAGLGLLKRCIPEADFGAGFFSGANQIRRAHLRRFVLQPLSEIAPDLILPGQAKTISQLLAGLPAEETVTRLDATP